MDSLDHTKLIRVFDRNNMPKGIIVSNTIILPSFFLETITMLCKSKNESAGWLICRKQFSGDFILYIVDCLYVSTTGGPASVHPSTSIKIENDNYTVLEFHIHPNALGDTWMNKFSSGDMITLGKRIDANRSYKHVLFSKNNVLTFGKERPEFRISNISGDAAVQECSNTNDYWTDIIRQKHAGL